MTRRPTGLILILAAATAAVSILAMIGWAVALNATARKQPLTITACTPATYDAPDGVNPGPPQSECARRFAERDDQHNAAEPIPVAGQVCNNSDEPVAYQIQVGFESVAANGSRFLVIDTPITYDPGCQLAYLFPFEVPSLVTAGVEPGESAGQWRIVGRANPVDTVRYLPYQWDTTATVEIIAPQGEPNQ